MDISYQFLRGPKIWRGGSFSPSALICSYVSGNLCKQIPIFLRRTDLTATSSVALTSPGVWCIFSNSPTPDGYTGVPNSEMQRTTGSSSSDARWRPSGRTVFVGAPGTRRLGWGLAVLPAPGAPLEVPAGPGSSRRSGAWSIPKKFFGDPPVPFSGSPSSTPAEDVVVNSVGSSTELQGAGINPVEEPTFLTPSSAPAERKVVDNVDSTGRLPPFSRTSAPEDVNNLG